LDLSDQGHRRSDIPGLTNDVGGLADLMLDTGSEHLVVID